MNEAELLNEIGRLRTYLETLRHTTPHRTVKEEIGAVLAGGPHARVRQPSASRDASEGLDDDETMD